MTVGDANATTCGLVCAHHHLYSTLARQVPGPERAPRDFLDILNSVWWRLDRGLDLEMIKWSAMLGAVEALCAGTTAIIDHHESPHAIEGSLDVIAEACAAVGVRVVCSYGVTDRHGPDGAVRGIEENRRFLSAGGRGMVGVHAAFTCSDDTLAAAADLAEAHRVGVHIHVAEGDADDAHWARLAELATDDWLLVHGVHLPDDHGLAGIVVHNPRSNMNNSVGYARPTRFQNPVALGSDGIGADVVDDFRVAYARAREDDVTFSADTAWEWVETSRELVPEVRGDVVEWSRPMGGPWDLAFTTGLTPRRVVVDGEVVLADGLPTKVDIDEVRARASEQATRLAAAMAALD